MLKRVAAITAGALLVTGVLAGCGEKKDKTDGSDTKTFTYWAPLNSSIASRLNSLGEVEMYKELEKRTGVHIEFVHPPAGQEAEQFNLMIASREMYDMVEYVWPTYPGGPQKAIDDGVIISLNDLIDKKAPNFKKTVSGSDDISKSYNRGSKTDDGNYFAFPAFSKGSYRTFGGPMIRKDWLDELGLSVPETIDEWDTALRAFKEKKGADAPLTGFPAYFLTALNSFHGAYGVDIGSYVEDGRVKYGPMEDGYEDVIALFAKWYKEGLLDRDILTNDSTLISSKITKGNSGAVTAMIGSGMGVYMKQSETEPSYNLVATPYPVLKKGDKNTFITTDNDVVNAYLAITSECKNPELAAEWIDYMYSEEGMMLENFGIEGVSYTMENGKPKYTDVILNNPDGLSVNEALGLYTRAAYAAPGFNSLDDYLDQYYKYDQQKDAYKLWQKDSDEAKKKRIPEGLIPLAEESEEYTALKNDIDTYVQESLSKFIQGSEPIENYDKFKATLKNSLKIDRFLELQQKMYDRYLKR